LSYSSAGASYPLKARQPPLEKFAVVKDIGRNLRRIRRERDLAQDQVAGLAGIRQQQLSAIENGLEPPLALVDRLARVLCVTPDELLRESRAPQPTAPTSGEAA
jgi:transcriptional regulator with XRE-family HTH domain